MRMVTPAVLVAAALLVAFTGPLRAGPRGPDANSAVVILGVKTVPGLVRGRLTQEVYSKTVLPDVGEVTFVPALPAGAKVVEITAPSEFKKPRPNCGTLHRDARVFRIRSGPLVLDAAIDANSPNARQFDVLRLDPTCKGDFRGAPVLGVRIVAGMSIRGVQSYQYEFVANPLDLQLGQRKLSVRFQCTLKEDKPKPGEEPARHVWACFSGAAVGRCRFGDANYEVRVPDIAGNLLANEKTAIVMSGGIPEARAWNFLKVSLGDGKEVPGFYGHPVLVDGKLWDVTISSAGDHISAKEFAGPVGKIHIDHPSWRLWVISERHKMLFVGGPDPVSVPVGRYWIESYQELGKAAGGSKVNLVGFNLRRAGMRPDEAIEVQSDKTLDLSIGSPIRFAVAAQVQGQTVRLTVNATDVAGRRMSFEVDRGGPMGEFGILDESGQQVGVVKIAEGSNGWEGTWTAPSGMKGTFRVSVPPGLCSVPLDVKPASFVLGGGS